MRLVFLGILASMTAQAAPTPCSLAVSVVTQLGTYRTWTNALENLVLSDKGYTVCQQDAPDFGYGSDAGCETEFKLELLYRPDRMTRNITIYKNGKALFDKDYPASPPSQRMMKTIPSCAEIQQQAELQQKSAE